MRVEGNLLVPSIIGRAGHPVASVSLYALYSSVQIPACSASVPFSFPFSPFSTLSPGSHRLRPESSTTFRRPPATFTTVATEHHYSSGYRLKRLRISIVILDNPTSYRGCSAEALTSHKQRAFQRSDEMERDHPSGTMAFPRTAMSGRCEGLRPKKSIRLGGMLNKF